MPHSGAGRFEGVSFWAAPQLLAGLREEALAIVGEDTRIRADPGRR
jgi:hypothetical protein